MLKPFREIANLASLIFALAFSVITVCAAAEPVSDPHQLSVENNRLFIHVKIKGVETNALLDSAAEMTLVDNDFAKIIGLHLAGQDTAQGSGGAQSVRFAKKVRIVAAGRSLAAATVAVIDMQDISKRLVGKPLTVILGREFFDLGRWEVNIEAGRIRPVSRHAHPAGREYPLETHFGIERFPVSINDQLTAMADFDLGNGTDIMIGKTFADQHGLLGPDKIIGQKLGGGIGGEVMRDTIVLRSLELGGHTFENVSVAVDAQKTAGELNVGISLLRRFVIVTDFPQHRLWLATPANDVGVEGQ